MSRVVRIPRKELFATLAVCVVPGFTIGELICTLVFDRPFNGTVVFNEIWGAFIFALMLAWLWTDTPTPSDASQTRDQ